MNKEIIPSIIAKNQEQLDNAIDKVKDHVDWIQLDVMDGNFVGNSSLAFNFTLPKIKCRYEAHLMLSNPESWIRKHGDKVDTLLAPIEACDDPGKIIRLAKIKGKRVGFALNPETPIETIKGFIDAIDQVLIMTVNPGFYGSEFLPETLTKVHAMREMAHDIDIEVDGSINRDTIKAAAGAGANLFVSGSFIMNAENPASAIAELEQQVKKEFKEEVEFNEENTKNN